MSLILQVALGIVLGFLILKYLSEIIKFSLIVFILILIPSLIYIFIEFVPSNFKSLILEIALWVVPVAIAIPLISALHEEYSPSLKKYFARIWANLSQRVRTLILFVLTLLPAYALNCFLLNTYINNSLSGATIDSTFYTMMFFFLAPCLLLPLAGIHYWIFPNNTKNDLILSFSYFIINYLSWAYISFSDPIKKFDYFIIISIIYVFFFAYFARVNKNVGEFIIRKIKQFRGENLP
jgi:hypothetical protein